MAVRDLDRGQDAAQRIRDEVDDAKLRVIHLDLADLRVGARFRRRPGRRRPA